MSPRTPGLYGSLALAALVGLAAATLAAGPCTAEAEGVAFRDVAFEQALREARTEGKRLFVEFGASWCPTCKRLEAEVLSTPRGAELTRDMVALRVDFDAESSRPLVERYVILGLPTVVILDADGDQLGRVTDYTGADQWLEEARASRDSGDPVPALRKLHEQNPRSAAATLRLGEALLVRGSPDEGQALLEQVTWTASGDEAGLAPESLFLLGRYYHRVKQDPAVARHIWRELATRFPDSEQASGAAWWYAKAEAELGHPEVGLAALKARAEAQPDDADAAVAWGEHVAKHGPSAERPAVLSALARVEKAVTDEALRREIDELRAKLRPE